MIVLDTNVVSEVIRGNPADRVVAWLDRQRPDDLYLTSVTVAELLYGVGRLPDGRRKSFMADRIGEVIDEEFGPRILASPRTRRSATR